MVKKTNKKYTENIAYLKAVIREKTSYIANLTKDAQDLMKENTELKEKLSQRQFRQVLTKDSINAPVINCIIKHNGTSQPSRIFCERIEYLHEKIKERFDHHLFFYNHGLLIFKIWLPNGPKDKEFDDAFEALDSCGIKCLVGEDE